MGMLLDTIRLSEIPSALATFLKIETGRQLDMWRIEIKPASFRRDSPITLPNPDQFVVDRHDIPVCEVDLSKGCYVQLPLDRYVLQNHN